MKGQHVRRLVGDLDYGYLIGGERLSEHGQRTADSRRTFAEAVNQIFGKMQPFFAESQRNAPTGPAT